MRNERIDLPLLFSLLAPAGLALASACKSAPEEPERSADRPGGAAPAAGKLSEAELASLIERGRALLDAGKPEEAEAVFAEAARADGDSLRTRMWVLRAWMDQGRSNDTLDALDALDRAGEKGPEMSYLYGMAFARRAEGYIADGVTDSSVQMNCLDATSFLQKAVNADPARFSDAFVPLARSAWYVQELETSRWAADRAVAVQPRSPEAWLARGRTAMAEFMAAEGGEPGGAAAEEQWKIASESFARAVELYGARLSEGAPAGAEDLEAARMELAGAATQLAHAMLWRKKAPEATDAYATAIGSYPQGFDYAEAMQLLDAAEKGAVTDDADERPRGFRAALELGRARFEEHGAVDDPRTAALDWWLGWSRFRAADWDGAEEAFQRAIARAPELANAWFYVGLARQYRKDSEGALAAMHAGWDADAAAMVATAAGNAGALRAFEELLGWCATQVPPRNLDAAFLAEMLAEALPQEPRHWNNLGLFLRDEGERLEIDAFKNKTPKPDEAVLTELYNRSYRAYERALELASDDPQLINDTGLMLHYHLGPDLAKAEAMYRRAIEIAEQRLAQPDLSEGDRERFAATRDDATINLDRVLHPRETEEEATEGAEAEAAPEAGAPQASEDGAASISSGKTDG